MIERIKIRIEKRDGMPAASTRITNAETGEHLDDVLSYSIFADVDGKEVLATLRRVEKRYVDGHIPEFNTVAEVVSLETDAIVDEDGDR